MLQEEEATQGGVFSAMFTRTAYKIPNDALQQLLLEENPDARDERILRPQIERILKRATELSASSSPARSHQLFGKLVTTLKKVLEGRFLEALLNWMQSYNTAWDAILDFLRMGKEPEWLRLLSTAGLALGSHSWSLWTLATDFQALQAATNGQQPQTALLNAAAEVLGFTYEAT